MLRRLFDDTGYRKKAIATLIDLFPSHGQNGIRIGDPSRLGLMGSGDFREMMSQPHGNGTRSWKSRPD